MADRNQKTFSRPKANEKSNKFTFDLGGLKLTPAQLDTIRNHALRNALTAAAGLLKDGDHLPSFNDFSNYVILHESAVEMPIGTGEFWKLRFGIRNDYTSEPPNPALENHDWSYFTQLVLSWQ